MKLFGPKNNPGEPLFLLTELADKVGLSRGQFSAALRHHPGLKPWSNQGRNSSNCSLGMYRMSDFQEWWKKVQEAKVIA